MQHRCLLPGGDDLNVVAKGMLGLNEELGREIERRQGVSSLRSGFDVERTTYKPKSSNRQLAAVLWMRCLWLPSGPAPHCLKGSLKIIRDLFRFRASLGLRKVINIPSDYELPQEQP